MPVFSPIPRKDPAGCRARVVSAWAGVAISACPLDSAALEVRGFSAERHERFTGFPEAPAFNDGAYFGSRKFTGVGWIPGEVNGRQFALVSPQHAVFALHYLPGPGTTLRFLNAAGMTVDRTVAGHSTILNEESQATDLCLVRLSEPLGEGDGVGFFPYLNLENEAAYKGKVLTVFGWSMKAGRSSVEWIEDSSPTSGFHTTRVMRFRYRKALGNTDDAYVVVGDSGSPSFGMAGAGGQPAIVGIHSAAGESEAYFYGYDSFIPHYISGLDAGMEADGYRMTPASPPPVVMGVEMAAGAPLKQGYAGSRGFVVRNTGVNEAGNVRVTVGFPEGMGPDGVAAAGWIAEEEGPLVWTFRKANVEVGGEAVFTAGWSDVPAVALIPVEVSRSADGFGKAVGGFELAPLPTFAAWAEGLEDSSVTGDSDGDGVVNLLEYAFGGNPGVASLDAEGGGKMMPRVASEDGRVVVRFPVRGDAAARGLDYRVEFSESLEAGSWSAAGAPEVVDELGGFDPEVPGFVERRVSWVPDGGKWFCRVRVILSEAP